LQQLIGDSLAKAFGGDHDVFDFPLAGASRILLEVRESNRPARRLYEKHAFREVGRRLKYYNHPLEDAILCERRCEPEQERFRPV